MGLKLSGTEHRSRSSSQHQRQGPTYVTVMKRLAYVPLLALAVVSTGLGLYPTVLTLALLVAIPVGFAAAVGIVAPEQVQRRRWLHRITLGGGIIIGLEVFLVFGWYMVDRRRPVFLVVQEPVPSRVRVAYGVADGQSQPVLAWTRRFDVPLTTIVLARTGPNDGWFKPTDPHPVEAMVVGPSGMRRAVRAEWVAGGRTQSNSCTFAYDEFVLGDSATSPSVPAGEHGQVGWLDSLNTWGLECRAGRLNRRRSARLPALPRTSPACYYDKGGGESCFISVSP